MLRAQLVAELGLTLTPRLLAGWLGRPRIVAADGTDVPVSLAAISESGGTLLTRGLVQKDSCPGGGDTSLQG